MAQSAPSYAFLAFLVVVVVVAASVGGVLLYEHNHPKVTAAVPRVAVGDNVTVNYIGLFGSGPEQGRVFDTSIKSVALDNGAYPKSLEFALRNLTQYTPLGVHVAPKTPRAGFTIGNTTFVGVVPGFWRGLLGLAVNQTRWVSFSDTQGYGPLNASCLRYQPLVEHLANVVTLPSKSFSTAYPGVGPFSGSSFLDPTYGWTDTVLSSNQTTVVVGYFPHVGELTSHAGWPVTVTAINGTTITLTNGLSTSNAGLVTGNLSGNATVCGAHEFVASAVNTNGTYTMNFNREVVGQTLVFRMTVVQIVSA